jgi:predicted nucleic acid-binding Zn ribbon protein
MGNAQSCQECIGKNCLQCRKYIFCIPLHWILIFILIVIIIILMLRDTKIL